MSGMGCDWDDPVILREREAAENAGGQVQTSLYEYGWRWRDGSGSVRLIIGSETLESAKRAMDDAIADGSYEILARTKGYPGEWKATA